MSSNEDTKNETAHNHEHDHHHHDHGHGSWHERWHRRHDGHHRGMWIKIPVMIILFIALKAFVVLKLWNVLIPEIFGGPVLTYLQVIGLLVLAKLIFGFGHHHHGRGHHWKRKFMARMNRFPADMSEEERAKLRAEVAKWCRK